VQANSESLKQKASELVFASDTGYSWIRELISEGFFDSPVSSKEVANRVAERFGRKWSTSRVQTYVRRFSGIIHAVKPQGVFVNYWVLSSVSRSDALQMIGKNRRIVEIEHQLFGPDLLKKLEKNFAQEIEELHGVFGKYGDSTAFLLRKILEKLLVIAFRKVGKGSLIEDKTRPGRLIGLEAIVELAMREKVNAVPLLTGKTGNEIKVIKFLGDTAAHNPMVNVHVTDIIPQMPFIITAYKELATHF
jgi:hypothetical protein